MKKSSAAVITIEGVFIEPPGKEVNANRHGGTAMNAERISYCLDRIKQAKESGETDTKLGQTLAKWKDIDIPIQRDGKWLLEGFILEARKQREIFSAIDPTISPDLPPHLLDRNVRQSW
jgi:hypothetical protein